VQTVRRSSPVHGKGTVHHMEDVCTDRQEVEGPGRMDQKVGHGHMDHPDEGVLCGMVAVVDHGDKGPHEVEEEEALWRRGQQDGLDGVVDGMDPGEEEEVVEDHIAQRMGHAVVVEERVVEGSPGHGCCASDGCHRLHGYCRDSSCAPTPISHQFCFL
jgi:hypothetical protein